MSENNDPAMGQTIARAANPLQREDGGPAADFLKAGIAQIVAQLWPSDEEHGELRAAVLECFSQAFQACEREVVKFVGFFDDQHNRLLPR